MTRVEIELPGKAEDVIAFLKSEDSGRQIYLYDDGCSMPLGSCFLERRNGKVIVGGNQDAALDYFKDYCAKTGIEAEPTIEDRKEMRSDLEQEASRQ